MRKRKIAGTLLLAVLLSCLVFPVNSFAATEFVNNFEGFTVGAKPTGGNFTPVEKNQAGGKSYVRIVNWDGSKALSLQNHANTSVDSYIDVNHFDATGRRMIKGKFMTDNAAANNTFSLRYQKNGKDPLFLILFRIINNKIYLMPNSSYNMSTYTEFKDNTPYEITMVLDTNEKWVQLWVNDIYLEIPDYSSLEPVGMEYAELGSDSSILRFQSSLSGNDNNVFQMDNISVKGITAASGGTIIPGIENGATGIAPADAAVYPIMSTVDWKNVGDMPVTASKSLSGGGWQTSAIEIQKKSLREIGVVFQEGELLANSQYKIHIGSTQALDGKALPEREFTFSTLHAEIQKPAITLISPLDGQTLAGNRIEVLAEAASHNLSGVISEVRFYLDGALDYIDTSAPFRTYLKNIPAGEHSVYAVCTDNYGESAISQTISFHSIENRPPQAEITYPLNAAIVGSYGTAVDVGARGVDSEIQSVALYLDNKLSGSKEQAPYTFQTGGLSAGPHTLYAVVKDKSGLEASSETVTIQVEGEGIEIFDDFESGAIGQQVSGNWQLVPKPDETGGSITFAGDSLNKYMKMKIEKVANPLAKDSYFNSPEITGTKKVMIDFRVNAANMAKGELLVLFRDNGNSSGSFMNLVKFTGNSMIAMPDIAGTNNTRTMPSGWNRVRIMTDFDAKTVSVYLNDTLITTEKFVSKWDSFLVEQPFRVRFSNSVADTTKGATDEIWLDDIRISGGFSLLEELTVIKPAFYRVADGNTQKVDNFKTGALRMDTKISNATKEAKTVHVIAALYDKGKLQRVWLEPKDIPAESTENVTEDYDIPAGGNGRYVKVMFWNGKVRGEPLTKSMLLMENDYLNPDAAEIIDRLKTNRPNKEHPRILADGPRFAEIRSTIASNATVSGWNNRVISSADSLLNASPPDYNKSDGLRLSSGYTISSNLYKLAYAYAVTKDAKYAAKAWENVKKAIDYPDWNAGNHFLDTSSLASGFALAYDWCYDYWTEDQKKQMRDTIKKYALTPAKKVYDNKEWWAMGTNNWCVVCNGGIAMAALSIGDEEDSSALCGEVLEKGMVSIRRALPLFAPDGAWFEGPGYWAYTVEYLAQYVASFDSALGSNYGIFDYPGISVTGYFPVYMIGATNRTFNLHDASEGTVNAPELGWLGGKLGDKGLSDYRYYQLTKLGFTPNMKDLLWFKEENISGTDIQQVGLPDDRMFRDSEVASFRNNFFGADSVFMAVHGGENNIPHGSLDIGQFVYEALGERWAIDLGGDNYNLAGYFDNAKLRWWYYRNRAESHNVIIMNPSSDILCDQELNAFAPISEFVSADEYGYAVVNTQPAYRNYVNNAIRGAYLDKNTGAMIVQDEISFKNSGNELYWFMHTKADVALAADGKSAILSQNGKRIWVGILSQGNEVFSEPVNNEDNAKPLSTSPDPNTLSQNQANQPPNPKTQNTNDGIRKLVLHQTGVGGEYRLTVALIPLKSGQTEPTVLPRVNPISKWEN